MGRFRKLGCEEELQSMKIWQGGRVAQAGKHLGASWNQRSTSKLEKFDSRGIGEMDAKASDFIDASRVVQERAQVVGGGSCC